MEGQLGVCETGLRAMVSSYGPYLGEEAPLRGWKGSSTIFLSRCNLRCECRQNHDTSQTHAESQTISHGTCNHLRARANLHFCEDPLQVCGHRPLTDIQYVGDSLVGQPLGHQSDNFPFTRA